MLRFQRVTKYFGEQILLREVSWNMGRGSRIGLVGCNGSGKTTLLRLIAGEIKPDDGSIWIEPGLTVRHLPQVPNSKVEAKSGGEKQWGALEAAMTEGADILLLDEPTNNLDERSMRMLEQTLFDYAGSIIVVSHDRVFLDDVVDAILEIDKLTAGCTEYGGNYSFYELTKEKALEKQWRMYSRQQEKLAQLQADIRYTKNKALATELSTVNDYYRARSKKVAATAKARETRLNRLLSDAERIDKPVSRERIRVHVEQSNLRNKHLIECRDVQLGYGGANEPVLQDVNLVLHAGERVAIVGDNGSGKSTLLKGLLGELEPSGGVLFRNPKARIAYLPQDSFLPEEPTVIAWLSEQLICNDICPPHEAGMRTYLHRFLFKGDDVFKNIAMLSCGERTRLQFAAFMANKPDALVLDEPTNHLDIESIRSIEDALKEFRGALIVVSHDGEFRRSLQCDYIWNVRDRRVSVANSDRSDFGKALN